MDISENTIVEFEPVREDPLEDKIQQLMRAHPRLDWLMCRTLLSYTEEELGELIERAKNVEPETKEVNYVQQSVIIQSEN